MNSGCWNLLFRPCVSKAVELVQHSWHVPTGRLSQVREDKSPHALKLRERKLVVG